MVKYTGLKKPAAFYVNGVKPLMPLQIDRSNRLAEGLILSCPFQESGPVVDDCSNLDDLPAYREIVSNAMLLHRHSGNNGEAGVRYGPWGPHHYFGSADQNGSENHGLRHSLSNQTSGSDNAEDLMNGPARTEQFSIICRMMFEETPHSSWAHVIGMRTDNGGSLQWGFAISPTGSSGRIRPRIGGSSGDVFVILSQDTWYTLAICYEGNDDNTVKANVYDPDTGEWLDGGTAVMSGPIANGDIFEIFGRAEQNRYVQGRLDYVHIWDRFLDDEEVENLIHAPWQVYKPRLAQIIQLPSGGGVIQEEIGQASETATAQAVASLKTDPIGQATETATAQTLASLKTESIGQPSETAIAQALSSIIAEIIGQASETDTSQSLASVKTRTLDQASETNTAQAITVDQNNMVAQVTETATAQSLTSLKTRPIGQVPELNVARHIAIEGTELQVASIVPSSPKPGEAYTINLNGVENAGGKTGNYKGQALTFTAQDITSASGIWPQLQTFGDESARYNQAYPLEVNDAGDVDSINVTTQKADDYDWHAITAISSTGIYANDTGVAVNDEHYGHFTSGDGTIETDGDVEVTTGFGVYEYWIYDLSESQWTDAGTETFYQVLSLLTQTNSVFGITAYLAYGIEQASETNTAQALTSLKTKTTGQASETATARSMGAGVQSLIGQALETDTAQPLAILKTRAIARGDEITSVQALTSGKTQSIDQASDTATASLLTSLKAQTVGQASDAATAQGLAFSKTHPIGQANETSTAQAVDAGRGYAVGQAAETATALALGQTTKTKAFGQAVEASSAFIITTGSSVGVNQVTETATAQAFSAQKTEAIGQPVETSTAQTLTLTKVEQIAQVAETDTSQAVTATATTNIGQVLETVIAFPIVSVQPISGQIGLVSAIDTATTMSSHKTKELARIDETDTAIVIDFAKAKAIARATETATAQTMGSQGGALVGFIVNSDGTVAIVDLVNSTANVIQLRDASGNPINSTATIVRES